MKSQILYAIIFTTLFLLLVLVLPLFLIYSQLEKLNNDATTHEADGGVLATCPILMFPCENSRDDMNQTICIDRHLHCDNKTDCPHGEDESKCEDISKSVKEYHRAVDEMLKKNPKTLDDLNSKTYHVNCSFNELSSGTCFCHSNHPEKVVCKYWNFTRIPLKFKTTIKTLNLDFNKISVIDSSVLNHYHNLEVLSLRNNFITHLRARTFVKLEKLKRLYFRGNRISTIETDALLGLINLRKIYLSHNHLLHLQLSVFENTPSIEMIDIANNQLDLHDQTFSSLANLSWIDIGENRLKSISRTMFSSLENLETLTLRDNAISLVHPMAFAANRRIVEIDLGQNYLSQLEPSTFGGLLSLTKLYLNNNPLSHLPKDVFRDLVSLNSLNMSGVTINNIDIHHFSANKHLTHIYFLKFRYCMFAPRVRICTPKSDGVSSLNNLLVYPILRKSVWIVALVTCFGNLVVFVWRSISAKEDEILSLFVKNLSVADLLMGLYLTAIGTYDSVFADNYSRHALGWMNSWQCSFCGFLAMLSSELSVLILALITVERYRCITANFRVVTVSSAKLNLAFAWLLAFLLAFYPIIHWSRTGNRVYYGSNGLCFPLHIDDPFISGWEYSAAVFLGINFPVVVLILILYVRMFITIKRDRKSSRPVLVDKKQEDVVLALRFFLIIMTDCLCWLPIVVIKVIAFTDLEISPSVYAWVVVLILPINSALNPVIYTLAAPTELHRKIYKNIHKVFLSIKCQPLLGRKGEKPQVVDPASFSVNGSEVTQRSSDGSVLSMSVIKELSTKSSVPGSAAADQSSSKRKFSNEKIISSTK